MKALEKDRTRRYETANGFANDIQRYLNDEAVVACPPSAAYRFKKFARRNKPVLLTAVVVTVALLLGIAGTTWQAIKATRSLRRAVEAERIARIEAGRANKEFHRANQEADNAKTEKAAAQAQRLRAESNLTLALDALDSVYLDAIGQERLLGGQAQLSEQEERLLEIGLDFYAQLVAQNEESTPATYETARAFLTFAYLQSSMANREAAHTAVVKAIAGLEELTNSYPDNADYFHALGSAYHLQGFLSRNLPGVNDTYAQAAGAYDKVVKLRPDDDVAWARRGFAYCRLGAYDKAIGSLDEAIRLNPKSAEAYRHRALTHFEAKEYQEAIADSTEAIRLAPEINGYVIRAAAYLKMSNCDLAIADANEAIRISPNDSWAYEVRAHAHVKLGNFERAIADSSEALRLTPTLAWTWVLRAIAHTSLENYDQAIADYNEAIRLDPENADWYELRAEAYLGLARYDEALADCNRYVELKGDDALTGLIRAQMLLIAGRTDEYRQACLDMLDRADRSGQPHEAYFAARTCLLAPEAIADPIRALELAKQARSDSPQPPWFIYTLGMAHLRAGELEEAARRFLEALDVTPTWEAHFLNWLGLALAQHQRGESVEARQSFGKAVELMERHPGLYVLDRLEGQLLLCEAEQLLGKPEEGKEK
jgi:tetratricopeptide (TPR) repeat protein